MFWKFSSNFMSLANQKLRILRKIQQPYQISVNIFSMIFRKRIYYSSELYITHESWI